MKSYRIAKATVLALFLSVYSQSMSSLAAAPESLATSKTPSAAEQQPQPNGKHKTIYDLVKSGKFKMDLAGDGTSTSHCTLVLTEKATGKKLSAKINTYCISKKTVKPPPTLEDGQKMHSQYVLGPIAPVEISGLVESAKKLAAENKFDGVPIPAERRVSTIAQLAIWQKLGGKDKDSKDAINIPNVKGDMLTKAKVDAKTLTDEENKKLEDRVALICDAVDLTCKTVIPVREPDKEPKTSIRQIVSEYDKQREKYTVSTIPFDTVTLYNLPYVSIILYDDYLAYWDTVWFPPYFTLPNINKYYQTMMFGGDSSDEPKEPRTVDGGTSRGGTSGTNPGAPGTSSSSGDDTVPLIKEDLHPQTTDGGGSAPPAGGTAGSGTPAGAAPGTTAGDPAKSGTTDGDSVPPVKDDLRPQQNEARQVF